jgi:hypothetical protein
MQDFGRHEWQTEGSALVMRGCLRRLGLDPDRRKQRLIFCGVARTEFDWCRNFWFREAVSAAEKWADGGEEPEGVPEVQQKLVDRLAGGPWNRSEWVWLALECVEDRPVLRSDRLTSGTDGVSLAFATIYRDLFQNPFVPINWSPDWKTSTVLDLTRTIYDRHAFDAMPILADALLDAGCDHQIVQEHCRSGRPHARGCWVLDALLGRS